LEEMEDDERRIASVVRGENAPLPQPAMVTRRVPSLSNWDEPLMPIRRDEPKVGRNDPCPCGSGKKYKKCCGA
jgi:preprotein translocase subunit SecA